MFAFNTFSVFNHDDDDAGSSTSADSSVDPVDVQDQLITSPLFNEKVFRAGCLDVKASYVSGAKSGESECFCFRVGCKRCFKLPDADQMHIAR